VAEIIMLMYFSSALLWVLWKKRKKICVFRGEGWTGMAKVMGSCARLPQELEEEPGRRVKARRVGL
jgi:hypothetical protein